MKNLYKKLNNKRGVFLFSFALLALLNNSVNCEDKIRQESNENPSVIKVNEKENLKKEKENLKNENISRGKTSQSLAEVSSAKSTVKKDFSQNEKPKITAKRQESGSEKKEPNKEKNKDNNINKNSKKNDTKKSDIQSKTTIPKKEAPPKTAEQASAPVQNAENNEGNNDGFAFIKSNAETNAWFKDVKMLLYGGIALILISIIGLFITLKPKKLKKTWKI